MLIWHFSFPSLSLFSLKFMILTKTSCSSSWIKFLWYFSIRFVCLNFFFTHSFHVSWRPSSEKIHRVFFFKYIFFAWLGYTHYACGNYTSSIIRLNIFPSKFLSCKNDIIWESWIYQFIINRWPPKNSWNFCEFNSTWVDTFCIP